MKNKNKTLVGFVIVLATTPLVASAQVAEYIHNLYLAAIVIAGLAAVIMIVVGAIYFTVSAGNPGRQKEGKDRITAAILGLILLLGAFVLLNTVNPELISLQDPELQELPSVAPGTGTVTPDDTDYCAEAQESCIAEWEMLSAGTVTDVMDCTVSGSAIGIGSCDTSINTTSQSFEAGTTLYRNAYYPTAGAQTSQAECVVWSWDLPDGTTGFANDNGSTACPPIESSEPEPEPEPEETCEDEGALNFGQPGECEFGGFAVGDRVVPVEGISGILWVRSAPSTGEETVVKWLSEQPEGAYGTIVCCNPPTEANSYTWWEIAWNEEMVWDGSQIYTNEWPITGWSAQGPANGESYWITKID